MEKILLNSKVSKKSSNVDNFINVELSTDALLLPKDDINYKINSYEEYISEKDSSYKYRMIFTINPICTNILFNANTEIVFHEGGEDCSAITSDGIICPTCTQYQTYTGRDSKLTYKSLIRDTAYSDKSMDMVYHCGIDIFNNHTLRRRNSSVINKIGTSYTEDKTVYNTMSDFLRDSNGDVIKEKILKINPNGTLNKEDIAVHLYSINSISSYKETVNSKLIENNGWVGFINPVTLNIPNYYANGDMVGTVFNKCMNGNKAGEQYDMYPDRSLYSFIPKYNKYRNRMENNWDYCITYPYANVEDNELIKYSKNPIAEGKGLHCEVIKENDLSDTIFAANGVIENKKIYLRTSIKNTLLPGNYISITAFDKLNFKNYETSLEPIEVEGIGYLGNDTSHIFSINLMPLFMVISKMRQNAFDVNGKTITTINLEDFEIRVRKHIKGVDCKYYIRKFRKLPNFNNTNVYLDGQITEEEIEKCIKPFNSSLNRLAYEENIYSDKIAQIVYNDDILAKGIKDNLGRELSEVFLTIIKRTKGNEKWYNEKIYVGEDIEFSHCFGNVSSGFDLLPDYNDYNIHKIHNVNNREVIGKTPLHLEQKIEIDSTEFFLGDIVEFSPYEVKETILEDVYHRFNTMQRETDSVFTSVIEYEEIESDDYDIGNTFETKTYHLDKNIHLNPEGYYYKPHYRICLKEYKDTVNEGCHIRLNFTSIKNISGNTFSGRTAVNYYLNSGDKLYFYCKQTHVKKIAEVQEVKGENYSDICFTIAGIPEEEMKNYMIYKPNPIQVNTAYDLEDGTGRYLWREFKSDKDMLPEDELYESIFTNGAHYRYQNINFYVRRQDPSGDYGLSEKCDLDNFANIADGKFKDISDAEYIKENEGSIC